MKEHPNDVFRFLRAPRETLLLIHFVVVSKVFDVIVFGGLIHGIGLEGLFNNEAVFFAVATIIITPLAAMILARFFVTVVAPVVSIAFVVAA